MESILTSTKKLAGIAEEYTHFDPDIIMFINSNFLEMKQMGVGPEEGFVIEDENATWDEFIPDNAVMREAAKTLMGAKVRLKFDPPTMTSVLTALQNTVREAEWRLCTEAELTKQV